MKNRIIVIVGLAFAEIIRVAVDEYTKEG